MPRKPKGLTEFENLQELLDELLESYSEAIDYEASPMARASSVAHFEKLKREFLSLICSQTQEP